MRPRALRAALREAIEDMKYAEAEAAKLRRHLSEVRDVVLLEKARFSANFSSGTDTFDRIFEVLDKDPK
jgi:hypothetical protein